MNRNLTICFTSDIHGYFSALDYTSGKPAATGLANCMASFPRDGNTLLLDGGDILQGSPFTYWLYGVAPEGPCIPAQMMNLAGYDFVTLGNHDFDYGRPQIQRYLRQLHGRCLCANITGVEGVEKTAVVTLANGLRVGLTGVTSQFVQLWEPPENLEGIAVTDAFSAAQDALATLKARNVDVTVCIYHGGFERDVRTGAIVSQTDENQGWRICQELDFDILLTGHQHQSLENLCLFGTYTCQTPDRAGAYIRMEVSVAESGAVSANSRLIPAGPISSPEATALLAPWERETSLFLDTPVGHLDTPLQPGPPLAMARDGSLIANFFNQVQLEASGADISATCLGSGIRGFAQDVTIRDIVATYLFSNTLKTIQVDRAVVKAALERSAEYFALDAQGQLQISDAFLNPIPQHYNYDFFSGLQVIIDVRRPLGDRVTSIRYQGRELDETTKLSLCLNSYRATGAGGYPMYPNCPLLKDQPTPIVQMIMDYVRRKQNPVVDKTRWLTILGAAAPPIPEDE